MAQRKKKPSGHQLQKIAVAQYRNDFFRKMEFIINSYCGENIYSLIPQSVLEKAYLTRCHSFSYSPAKGCKIARGVMNDTKCILPNLIKTQKLAITPKGHEITITDYFTVGITIFSLHASLKDNLFPHAARVKTALYPFTEDSALFDKANEQLCTAIQMFGYGQSDLGECLYWLKHSLTQPENSALGMQSVIEIYSHVPESTSIVIDGIARPIIPVGWAFAYTGIEWVSLKPSVLNIDSPFAEIPLKVFIQSHALQRLAERIDCFWIGLLHLNMYVSLRNPKVFYDSKDNLLIEYRFFDTKAGYFRVDIVDGVIVLRTFLFVTNNGTPEGQMLEKNTGLQKLDKKYLAIDKLSTFMSSDIGDNQEVRKIFIDAGCSCLLDLYEKTNVLSTKHPNQTTSTLMLDYLGQRSSPTSIPLHE